MAGIGEEEKAQADNVFQVLAPACLTRPHPQGDSYSTANVGFFSLQNEPLYVGLSGLGTPLSSMPLDLFSCIPNRQTLPRPLGGLFVH